MQWSKHQPLSKEEKIIWAVLKSEFPGEFLKKVHPDRDMCSLSGALSKPWLITPQMEMTLPCSLWIWSKNDNANEK